MYVKILLFHLALVAAAESCLVKQTNDKYNYDKSERKVDKRCECGLDIERTLKNWAFQIETKFGENEPSSYCLGTLITSNLIATSHRCLMGKKRKMNLYDLWDGVISEKNVISVEDITVDFLGYSYGYGKIPVDKVILNPRFAVSSARGIFPEDDLALLRIHPDNGTKFTGAITIDRIPTERRPAPICIPTYEDAFKLLHQNAHYYGVGKRAKHLGAGEVDYRGSGITVILPGSDCDRDLRKEGVRLTSNLDSVCIKDRQLPPNTYGGPLIVNSMDKNKNTAFLAGLASWIGEKHAFDIIGPKYTYFSHIAPLVKYIEHKAKEHGSFWCETPKLKLPEGPISPPKEDFEWEKLDLYKRDDSLDCVCGHSKVKEGGAQGRIVGGKEATPHEFPWLVKIAIVVNGQQSLCGGSIINDKMILTAAHCANKEYEYDALYFAPERFHKVKPDELYVLIKSHLTGVDPVEQRVVVERVISNPNYLAGYRSVGHTDFDIALLVLKERLKFPKLKDQQNQDVVPVCLPSQDKPIDIVHRNGQVAGWGVLEIDDPDSSTAPRQAVSLQKVDVPIEPLEKCMKLSSKPLSATTICGTTNPDKDSGQGDSGGPLIIPRNLVSSDSGTQHWVQVGIVSFGEHGLKDKDGKFVDVTAIYANVQTLLPFIDYYSKKHGAKWCKYEADMDIGPSSGDTGANPSNTAENSPSPTNKTST